ncbi:serine/threonine-protein kinase [Sphaerimonospora sp. CA-214678]|uniref:serine/threonine-protein kinase n=1 Tax=Sphaerimonospora sp. CA-214678 TaxID=3240029 RepID=UPI003D8CDC7B
MRDGRRVAGRYHLLEPIGRGGMGVVWRAHDELLDRPVAVKEVLYHPMSEEDRREFTLRTIREARAAGRIDHPNVVVVHDVIEEDGRPWIVMQLVRARSLGEALREHGPLVPERVASIGAQVLDALCTAHAAGVLHRDVKPENVLIGADGRVVLTDFGIATMPGETALTMTGSLSGTPAFLPPERLNGLPATPESDLWSLGATLYAAVEGRPPFERNTPIATMAAVLSDEPEPPRRAGVLAPVIMGLLRKNPAERIDALETAELLAAASTGDHAGPRSRPAPSASTPPASAPSGSAPPAFRPTAPPAPPVPYSTQPRNPAGGRGDGTRSGRNRMVMLALLPVLLTGAGAGGWYGYRTLSDGSPASAGASSTPPDPPPSTPPSLPSPTPSSTPEPADTTSPPPAVPSPKATDGSLPRGWSMYHDPRLGFSVALPRGWKPYDRQAARVWFRRPGSTDYLLIDRTQWEEKDPVAQLTRVEATSTGRNLLPGYARIRLEPLRYRGVEAADWEFTFEPGQGKVRVLDRGFRFDDGRCFTIYWQVADARWTTGLAHWRMFTASFRPR